jgi:hypothetical protein
MATSYDQLLTDIPAWMVNESGEFAEQLPRFIDLAELRLSRDLSTVNAFNHVTDGLTLTAGSPYLDLPADVVTIRIIRWQDPDGRWLTVEKKDLPFIMEWWPDPAETGDPRYYAYETDSRLYLAATPADSYPVQVHYRRRLPALSESNPTNWLTENAGDALLYACLCRALQGRRRGRQRRGHAHAARRPAHHYPGDCEHRRLRPPARAVRRRQSRRRRRAWRAQRATFCDWN